MSATTATNGACQPCPLCGSRYGSGIHYSTCPSLREAWAPEIEQRDARIAELEARCAGLALAADALLHNDSAYAEHLLTMDDLAPWVRLVEAVREYRAADAAMEREFNGETTPAESAVSAHSRCVAARKELIAAIKVCGIGGDR